MLTNGIVRFEQMGPGILGLLASYIKRENRISLEAARGMRSITFFIILHDQT